MDRLAAMELFAAAIDAGSLSGGARRLGRPAVAATRAVAMLEREVGEPVLVRSTRRIGLTPAGEHWLAIWREVLAQLAAGRETPGGGRIVLTAPEQFGRTWVQPLLEAFLLAQPHVEAQLLLLSRTVDLLDEGVDLAVRVDALPDNGVAAASLGQVRNLLCAAPAYLDRRGQPTAIDALAEHDLIARAGRTAWRFADPAHGRRRTLTVAPHLVLNSAEAIMAAALRGAGIGHVMSCQALPEIEAGRLVPVLSRYDPGTIPVHLVFRGRPPRAGVVREFVDQAVPELRRQLHAVDAAIEATIAASR